MANIFIKKTLRRQVGIPRAAAGVLFFWVQIRLGNVLKAHNAHTLYFSLAYMYSCMHDCFADRENVF
jgi:hypothetical protein